MKLSLSKSSGVIITYIYKDSSDLGPGDFGSGNLGSVIRVSDNQITIT